MDRIVTIEYSSIFHMVEQDLVIKQRSATTKQVPPESLSPLIVDATSAYNTSTVCTSERMVKHVVANLSTSVTPDPWW